MIRSGRVSGLLLAAAFVVAAAGPARAGDARSIDSKTHHLRSGENREWEEFALRPDAAELVVRFNAAPNAAQYTLRLRQRDVKQSWRVRLNGASLGTLVQDENEIVALWAVPPGTLKDGENELRVACESGVNDAPDDVLAGDVELIPRPRADVLGEAKIALTVVDSDGGAALPCRVTIVDSKGGLATTGNQSGDGLAVRPGVIYTLHGRVSVSVPAGRYTVYAGRGFEYSVATATLEVKAGELAEKTLRIRRVVPTDGSVSCDPHVHTLTYSRHGDCTLEERMITLAGEGIELPVATEHNLQIDYAAAAEKLAASRYFRAIVGNEVTTATRGHFNVFPVSPDAKLINWRGRDWAALSRSIADVAPGAVVILNHARDVHGGFAPFGPDHHISVAGEAVDGSVSPANAMEVVNSGATRADPMELFGDWFGMLNRGRRLSPIGASDSHDVARYIVGQARTYVRSAAANADGPTAEANRVADSILQGRVSVSYGLLTRLAVGGQFTPGDLAILPPPADSPEMIDVDVRVLGPEWTTAERVALYANGIEIRHAEIPHPAPGVSQPAPVKYESRWKLPRPAHDVHLVAIATGPGVVAPYWPAARPYQPRSPRWQSYVLGATGAVFVDADGNDRFDSAFDYATGIVAEVAAARPDGRAGPPDAGALAAVLAVRLARYDEAVAAQAASVLRARDPEHFEATCRVLVEMASPVVARGVSTYLQQWRQTTAAGGGARN